VGHKSPKLRAMNFQFWWLYLEISRDVFGTYLLRVGLY